MLSCELSVSAKENPDRNKILKNHSLLLEKLSAYGFDNNSWSFAQSCLTNRFKRWKIENYFSNWYEITTDAPQCFILGPLLFNVLIYYIFLFVESLNDCNYADDKTLFVSGKTFDEVIRKLKNDSVIFGEWFFNNFLVLNSDKCHFMTLGTTNNLTNF